MDKFGQRGQIACDSWIVATFLAQRREDRPSEIVVIDLVRIERTSNLITWHHNILLKFRRNRQLVGKMVLAQAQNIPMMVEKIIPYCVEFIHLEECGIVYTRFLVLRINGDGLPDCPSERDRVLGLTGIELRVREAQPGKRPYAHAVVRIPLPVSGSAPAFGAALGELRVGKESFRHPVPELGVVAHFLVGNRAGLLRIELHYKAVRGHVVVHPFDRIGLLNVHGVLALVLLEELLCEDFVDLHHGKSPCDRYPAILDLHGVARVNLAGLHALHELAERIREFAFGGDGVPLAVPLANHGHVVAVRKGVLRDDGDIRTHAVVQDKRLRDEAPPVRAAEVQCALLHRCGVKRIRRRLLRAFFRVVAEKAARPFEYAQAKVRHGLFAHIVDVFLTLGGEQRRIECWVSDVRAWV